MKTTITLLLIVIVQLSFIRKTQSQTMLWDEKYAETVFKDDFSGSTLDSDKWNVAIFKRDIGLLIDSSATLKVNNGNLELTMINCPNCEVTNWAGTTYHGNYAGGEVGSKELFKYGIYECRAKYATNLGSWPAFWIIGGDGTPCPPGGYGNEIDIAEVKCQTWITKMGHVIFRYYPPANCDISNVVGKDSYIYNMQLNNIYYDYKCIWTPNKISYYINNNLRHEVFNTGQEWYPELYLSIILSQQVITASNILGQFTVVTPQTSYFDMVSVKEFFATPVITCPGLICSTETATLSVDPEATNFTWGLTPVSLFSGGKTGTGKTASITAASGASGEGKITYSFEMPSGETFSAEQTFWVGEPDPDDFYIVGLDNYGSSIGSGNYFEVCENNYYTFYLYPVYNLPETHHRYGITDVSFYFDFDYEIVNEGYGWAYVYVNSIDGNSTGLVDVDACDYLNEFMVYDVDEGYCGYYLMFSPNPSTGETTLSIESTSEKIEFDEDAEWDIEVYGPVQNLKQKKTKLKGKEHNIQTAGWKEGVYFVRVKYKDEILTGKLVVKK